MMASAILRKTCTSRVTLAVRRHAQSVLGVVAQPNVRATNQYYRLPKRCLSSSVPAPTTTEDRTPTTMMDLSVSAKIEGEESQIVTVQLKPGEALRAESASMLYMTEGVEMDTTLGGDGVSGGLKRMLTGQNVFLTDFSYRGSDQGTVALGTDFPSKILRLSLEDMHQHTLICQRGAYLASNPSVQIDMEFTKSLTAGFFGGQGFVLQKLSGAGDVLVKGGGTIVTHDLSAGETLRVSSGSLVAFDSSVQYDVQMMKGIKNAMFGGEGLFVTTLTGPGRVWLQGMPPDRMIAEIARRVPAGGPGIGIPIGVGGGSGEEGGGVEGGADEAAADAAAAADASVEGERAATVATASSAAEDSESPSALFGDAAYEDDKNQAAQTADDPLASDHSGATEPSFAQEDFSDSGVVTEEPVFDDDEFSTSSNDNITEGELFDDDPTSTEGLGDVTGEDDASSGIFQTLWDIFSGSDE